jgi:hypothetical protein
MEWQNDSGTLPIVELLGVDAGTLTDEEGTVAAPVVFLTFRPEPHDNWCSFTMPISLPQAIRLRNDLTTLLDGIRIVPQLR